MKLDRVSVGVRTFIRDAKLYRCLHSIHESLPETEIVVADCGEHNDEKDGIYAELIRNGHKVIWLKFDAGLGAMTNALIDNFTRDYLLVASDDFLFTQSVREGIEKMVEVLDHTDMDIAAGRVRGPYEFDLEDNGDEIIEHPVRIPIPTPWYIQVDLTVNYCLYKRRVFSKIRWDENKDTPINGGEHGSIFLDIKRAGYKVGFVPGVSISEQSGDDGLRYREYRSRGGKARPCFERRGIRRYQLGTGQVDYERVDYKEPITR